MLVEKGRRLAFKGGTRAGGTPGMGREERPGDL